jgi:hypothetical protein
MCPKKKDSAAPEGAETAPKKRTPIRTIRVEDCSISIWHRTHAVKGKLITFYSLTLERSYRDKEGGWRYTKSFGPEDLPRIVILCQQAETAIAAFRQQDAERPAEAEDAAQ